MRILTSARTESRHFPLPPSPLLSLSLSLCCFASLSLSSLASPPPSLPFSTERARAVPSRAESRRPRAGAGGKDPYHGPVLFVGAGGGLYWPERGCSGAASGDGSGGARVAVGRGFPTGRAGAARFSATRPSDRWIARGRELRTGGGWWLRGGNAGLILLNFGGSRGYAGLKGW